MRVEIYTDGAARGNPEGPGGYGAVLVYVDPSGTRHERELSAGYQKTTNNRMELMGVIAALEALKRPCEVDLYSDSQYVVKAFNEHWIKDGWSGTGGLPKKNRSKIKRYGRDCSRQRRSIRSLGMGLRDMRDIPIMKGAISWQQQRRMQLQNN